MGLRYRKSISLGKGIKLNLSKSGPSISFGTKGFRQTISATGRMTTSVGIPGTGASYTKTVSAKKLLGRLGGENSEKNIQAEKRKPRQSLEEKQSLVDEFENRISMIRSLHKTSFDAIDWNTIIRDREAMRTRKEQKRGIFAGITSLFSGQEKEEEANIESLGLLADQIQSGDFESYIYVLEEMNPFEDLLDYGSDFEVGINEEEKICVEFNIKSEESMPDKMVSLTANNRLSIKDMPKTTYYEILQDYVCSASIRIARDVFAILPIENFLLIAKDAKLNTATGNMEEENILMIDFKRRDLENINFDRIDPSDMIESLDHFMKFKKSSGFEGF